MTAPPLGDDKRDWITRMLGVTLPGGPGLEEFGGAPAGRTSSGKIVKASPVDASVAPPGAADNWASRPRSGAPIRPAMPPPTQMAGAHGRTLGIAKAADGRVALTAPPPPVRELTFAGGGGKGAALPGAVRALQDFGVLKDVKVINGASVGSMTASLIAAGCTADEFADIANDPTLADHIKEGKNMAEAIFGGGLTGEGLENLLRSKLSGTLRKRGVEYVNSCINTHQEPDKAVVAVLEKLADSGTGPTFGDLRTLSKVIPAIKEVSISASFMAEVDPSTGKVKKQGKAQLAMFNADTEPDMEVALASRASAALPPIFKPVDITLSSGITARFQDGGVLNNVPTKESLGAERDLDPIPESGSMTFIFQNDDAEAALKGQATPNKSRLADWLTKAPNSAANYATSRDLANNPEDIVMVPLKFTAPPKKQGGRGEQKDFSGLLNGTANFNIAGQDRATLQSLAKEATDAHIQQREKPKTREFASMDEMLMSVSRDDLAALAKDKLEGAADALKFRDAALAAIGELTVKAKGMTGKSGAAMGGDATIKKMLADLDKLAAGNHDRQGFIGREMNRTGDLDRLLAAVRKSGGSNGAVQAGVAVADALDAQAHVRTILREAIYPRIVDEDPKGPSGMLLAQVDSKLRAATGPQQVNAALQLLIDHYRARRDILDLHDCKKFAASLNAYLMKTA